MDKESFTNIINAPVISSVEGIIIMMVARINLRGI